MTVRKQFLQIHKTQEQELKRLFENLAADVIGTLRRYTDLQANSRRIRTVIADKVTALFLTRTNNTLAPFILFNGSILPLSPYMAIIWKNIKLMTELAVSEQEQIMLKRLEKAPDVVNALKSASGDPFESSVLEFHTIIAEVNKYDPTRSWVQDGGYNLSDRIWQTSTDMRSKLDAYLDEAINSGKSMEDVAREIQQYLIPGRQLPVTFKPYGKNGSFNAVRLARTEITAAYSRSSLVAAKLNPFIAGYKTRRSSHSIECPDHCDPNEAGGPYELDDLVHAPPLHSHCLCSILWVMRENPVHTANELKSTEHPLRKIATALNPKRFVEYLLSFYK